MARSRRDGEHAVTGTHQAPRASRTARPERGAARYGWLGAIRQTALRRWPGALRGRLSWWHWRALSAWRNWRHPYGLAIHHEDPAAWTAPALAGIAERYGMEDGYTLPIRGDAQERDGGCAPAEPRPAAGADVTGLLSPRHAPREGVNQEGARLVSAPPAGHTHTSPAGTANAPVNPTAAAAVSITRPHTQLDGATLGGDHWPGAQAGGARPSPALPEATVAALAAGCDIARSMTEVE